MASSSSGRQNVVSPSASRGVGSLTALKVLMCVCVYPPADVRRRNDRCWQDHILRMVKHLSDSDEKDTLAHSAAALALDPQFSLLYAF